MATNGKIKQWSIEVVETMGSIHIRTLHGYEGGKLQQNEKTIIKGKNIGRSNETTPLQQAISEAQSTWQKKRDEKYAPRSKDAAAATAATAVTNTNVITRNAPTNDTVPSPMLAHDYNKRGRSLLFPCYVQPKLDGTRMVAIPGNGLFSRNRKAYPHLEHIREEIDVLSANIILDGELYSDTLTFQEIVGLVKNETLQPTQEQVKFYVYDIINDQNFQDRCITLRWLFKEYNFQHLVLVKTEHCESENKMKEKHAEYVADGYEGIFCSRCSNNFNNKTYARTSNYKCSECKPFWNQILLLTVFMLLMRALFAIYIL
jgi:DNA ligase-1